MDSPTPLNFPVDDSSAPAGTRAGPSPRIGQVYLDVSHKRLHFLNQTAHELRRDGVPFTGSDLAKYPLQDFAGRVVTVDDLPMMVAMREQRSVEKDFRLIRKGRTPDLVWWSAAPYKGSKGKMMGVLGSVCRVPPEPDWPGMAGLAHDLRTPLNALKLLASLLETPNLTKAGLEENLEDLRSAVDRALDVSKELLEWCRGAANRHHKVEREWFSLESFLNHLVREQMPAAQQKGIALNSDMTAIRDWEVHTNQMRLARLLSNLLVNAVRYTPAGSVTLTASWRTETKGQKLVLGVVDTGSGISPEEHESIFQPFARGQAGMDSDSGGSGLGLAVVDRLLEELGLELKVDSQLGRGSTFHLLIPITMLRRTSGADTARLTTIDTLTNIEDKG